MIFRKYSRYALHFSLLALFFLQGCSIGGKFLQEVKSFNSVKKDEVIIVGRISITPKIGKDEQELDAKGVIDVMGYGAKNKNRAMIQFNAKPNVGGYKYVINPKLGKLYFFKVPRGMKYIVDGSILTEFTRYGASGQILLPTGFKIDIKPSDKAIYIGDLTYTRDDFNSITKVRLKNNYKKVRRLFRKKFGKKYKLRKSLIRTIKN